MGRHPEGLTVPYKDPEQRRAVTRESVRRHRATQAGGKPSRKPELPELRELRYDTVRGVLELLDGQIEALLGDRSLTTIERARTITYVVSCILRAIEQRDVVARLEALEMMIEQRANGSRGVH